MSWWTVVFSLLLATVFYARVQGAADLSLQPRKRMVFTLSEYEACKVWEDATNNEQSCATLSKCYGRRMVLDVTLCGSQDDMESWFRTTFLSSSIIDHQVDLVSAEEDEMVMAGQLFPIDNEYQSHVVFADSGTAGINSELYAAMFLNNSEQMETVEMINAAMASSLPTDDQQKIFGMGESATPMYYTNPWSLEQWNLDLLDVNSSFWMNGKYGKGNVVAVLDSGIAMTASQAFSSLLSNNGMDFISDLDVALDGDGRDTNSFDPGDRSPGECETSSWHGTYVSSVLAATHQEEFKGLAPDAYLLPVRVLGKCKMGYASDVADAIAWAVGANIEGMDQNVMYPAKTVVMSFTGKGVCPSYLQSVITLAVDTFGAKLYAAAGNDARNAHENFPANCIGVESVGALDKFGLRTAYSSTNASVSMPGGTWEYPVPCLGPTLQVGGCVGTSMAVPHAAGLRALELTDYSYQYPRLTAEQQALNLLPHATYKLAPRDQDGAWLVEGVSCSPPSLLYNDGFCGIRMNTTSDLRTIWTIGYPLVELQPGTYNDATMHCSLAANVNNGIGFTATHLFARIAGTVVFSCTIPVRVTTSFSMAYSNVSWTAVQYTTSGSTCTGAGSTLSLNNFVLGGPVGSANGIGGNSVRGIRITAGCALVLTGFMSFSGLMVTSWGSCIMEVNDLDVQRSVIDVESWTVNTNSNNLGSTTFLAMTFSSMPSTELVWNVKQLSAGSINIGLDIMSFTRCRIAVSKFEHRTVAANAIRLVNSIVRFTDSYSASGVTLANNLFAVDVTSILVFDSSMPFLELRGRGNLNFAVVGGRVLIKCNNVFISGSTTNVFTMTSGGYVELSGSNMSFLSTLVSGSGAVFSLAGGSMLNISGSDVTFSGNSAAGSGGVVHASSSSIIIGGGNITFSTNYATNGGVINLLSSSAAYVTGKNISFVQNTATGNGGAIYLDSSLLSIGDSVSFERNIAHSLVLWYPFASAATYTSEGFNRSLYQLTAYGATSFNVSATFPLGSGSIVFDGTANTYATIPFYFDPYVVMATGSGGISISFWYRMSTSSSSASRIFSFADGSSGTNPTNHVYVGRSAATNNIEFFITGTTAYVTTTGTAVNNAFRHVVWTITAAGAWNIYLDGNLVCNGCRTRTIPQVNWTRLFLGRAAAATDVWFTGAIDDFMVFSSILTQVQVSTLYVNSSEGAGLLSVPDFGGAIHAQGSSIVTVNGTNFTGNIAGQNGGAIFVDRFSGLNLSNSQFVSNVANVHGGGIAMDLSYRPITLTNIVAQGNTAKYGDGGFLYINGTCYFYSNNTWENLNCTLNSASMGRGGCIFLENTESVTMIPYDVNIVNPIVGIGNQALQGNFIFSVDSWIKISGGNLLLSSSLDAAASLQGLSTFCTSYPCRVDNFFSGDPVPQFGERCPAGQVLNPVTKSSCIAPCDPFNCNLIAAVSQKIQSLVLWPGYYFNPSRMCGAAFTVSAGFNSFILSGVGLSAYTENSVVIDCGSINMFTVGVGFNMSVSNLTVKNARSMTCSGAGAMLKMHNIYFTDPTTETLSKINVNTNCAIVMTGYFMILRASSGTYVVQFSDVDVERSDVSANLISIGCTSEFGKTIYISNTALPSKTWVWKNTCIEIYEGYGRNSISMNNVRISIPCVRVTNPGGFSGGGSFELTNSVVNITGELSRSTLANGYYAPRSMFADMNSNSVIFFQSTMTKFLVEGFFNTMYVNGGKVYIQCDGAVVRGIAEPAFWLINGAYLEWSGSNAVFQGSTANVFFMTTGSVVNFTGSNIRFTSNWATNYGSYNWGTLLPFGGAFYMSGSTLYMTGSNIIFSNNAATGGSGGAIYASSASAVFIGSNNVTFTGNYATVSGAAVYAERSRLKWNGTNISFQDNAVAPSTFAWYPMDGTTVSSVLQDGFSNRSSYMLTNNGTSFSNTNAMLGTASLVFTAVTQTIILPPALNPYPIAVANGITFSMWLNVSTSSASGAVVMEFNARTSTGTFVNSNYCGFYRNAATANLQFLCGSGVFTTSSGTPVNSAWHHVAWSISSAGSWSIYLDNVLLCNGCQTVQIPNLAWQSMRMGGGMLGNLDDFRVFSNVLSAADVSTLFMQPSTVVWYPFEGGSDAMWLDNAAVDQNKMAQTGSNALTPSTALLDRSSFVKGASSLQFTQTNQGVMFPSWLDPYAIMNANGITISLWYRMSTLSSEYGALFRFDGMTGSDNVGFFGLYKISTTGDLTFWCARSERKTTTKNFVNNVWRHIVWGITKTGVWYIYIDNSVFVSDTVNAMTKTIPIRAWHTRDIGPGMIGNIDDFRIFSKVLTASEVNVLWTTQANVGSFVYGTGLGGAISVNGSVVDMDLVNASFRNNFAGHVGGAIHSAQYLIDARSSPGIRCQGCSWDTNVAWNGAGAIFTEKYSMPIVLTNTTFMDNCVTNPNSNANARHAISMGYYFGSVSTKVSSLTPLLISGTGTAFQRTPWNSQINCPYIRGDEEVNISRIDSSVMLITGVTDIMVPGFWESAQCSSAGGSCSNFSSFYSGAYVEDVIVLDNSMPLAFLTTGWDSQARMVDSSIFMLRPGTYTNGICNLNFAASGTYVNVTLVGGGVTPADTVINCASSASFATVGVGFTLNLKNLYIVRGSTSGGPTISVLGTLFTENVTVGGTLGGSATRYGILCTGATATCNFAGNTTFEGINGGTAFAVALHATASASVQMSGNLTIQNTVGTYALRLEQLSRSSTISIQNLVVQNNSAGFLLFPNIASSVGSILFSVTQSARIVGNSASTGHLIHSNIVLGQSISIQFGGDFLVIANNTFTTGSVIVVNNAAAHAQGLPQISMTPANLVDISSNTVSLQLLNCQAFCYFLLNVPGGNVTISGNTVTSANTHMIHFQSTSSRMQWTAGNLTLTRNQLTTVTFALIDVTMGVGMSHSIHVLNWLWVEPRTTPGPYVFFVDGTISSGALGSMFGILNNVYISGSYGCVHGLPNGASASFSMAIAGSLTVVGSPAFVQAFRIQQVAASGPRSRLSISGNYTFVGNRHGLILADTYADVVFTNTSWGIIANNTISTAGINLLQATATSSAISWNGIDLTVQNNAQPASTSVFACTFSATNTHSFLFSGIVLAENNMTAQPTVNFLTVTGTAGSFSLGGNNFIARGFQSVLSVSLGSAARLNRATFTGYFEISSRPLGTGAAISISQTGLSPGANGVSLELAGFYNFSNNVAASNPIMNLLSNAVVYLVGAGGIVQNNRATGTGTQVLFTVASATNSVLMFAGSIESMLPVMVNTTQFYRSAIHMFVSNTATFMTTCVAGTIAFNSSGSTCFLNQTRALSCQVNSNSTCINCLPGSYVDINTVVCKQCPAGSFTNMSGLSTCSACVGGTFAATQGSTICSNCPAGFSSTNVTTN